MTRFTQKDGVLCCWLTQSVATQTIQFSYIPKGGTNESYATAPLAVTLHANAAIACAKQDSGSGTVTNVAEVNGNVYETLGKALDAVKTGGTISLINNAVLNEVMKPTGKIVLQLNGFTLSSSGVAGMEPGEGDNRRRTGNGYLLYKRSLPSGGFRTPHGCDPKKWKAGLSYPPNPAR